MSKEPINFKPLPAPRVEIINLIDVLITLIAFFLLTTVFAEQQRQVKINLPHMEQSSQAQLFPKQMVLELTKEGRIFHSGALVAGEELAGLFKRLTDDDLVIIRADRDCRYQSVITLLDQVKAASLNKVSLEVRK